MFIFISIFYSTFLFSQNDTVYISGRVSSENSSGQVELVKKALIHLKLSNGGMFEHSSNDSGYYSFKVKKFDGIGELTIATDKKTSFINSKTTGFLANKTSYSLNFSEPKNYVYDFSITKVIICYSFPTFLFKLNSTEPYWQYSESSSESPEESINLMAATLKDNPTIIIEIWGHCDSKEKNQAQLSLNRAEYYAQELVKKGIDTARLLIKGYGSKKPLIKEEQIKKVKTKEEKEALHQKNRRVVFRIISWDYVDPNTPKSNKPEKKENSEFIED